MTTAPARGCVWAIAGAMLLNLLARASGGRWLAVESGVCAALVLTSLVLRPRIDQLEVRLTTPLVTSVGEELVQQLLVRNPTDRVIAGSTWQDLCAGLSPASVPVPALGPGAEFRATLGREVLKRGVHGAAASLRNGAPFGLIVRTVRVPVGELVVRPRLVEVEPERRRAGRPGDEGRGTGQAGHGTEVLGLRPWRPGDHARDVSARASARHGRPVVLEREREEAPGPLLVVMAVGGKLGQHWEEHVSLAASLTVEALRERRPVVLVAGSGVSVPRHVDEVLDFFAAVDDAPDLPEEAFRAALAMTHPGGTSLHLAGSRATWVGADRDDGCCQRRTLRG